MSTKLKLILSIPLSICILGGFAASVYVAVASGDDSLVTIMMPLMVILSGAVLGGSITKSLIGKVEEHANNGK
jgi:hypothetical protein